MAVCSDAIWVGNELDITISIGGQLAAVLPTARMLPRYESSPDPSGTRVMLLCDILFGGVLYLENGLGAPPSSLPAPTRGLDAGGRQPGQLRLNQG